MLDDLLITVVPNWNLKTDLIECLESLRRVSYAPHRIIVVDNGSTDGSAEMIPTDYPDVILIALPENWGYAAALNAGIVRALALGAVYVVALNNDTVVPFNTFSRLVSRMAQDPGISIVAPKILYYSHPDLIFSLGDRMYRWLPVPRGYGYKWKDSPSLARLMEFDYVTGCAMLIQVPVSRDRSFRHRVLPVLRRWGFLSSHRDRGGRIVCDGSTVIYHKASLSTGKDRTLTSRIRARNRVRFYRRHRHGPSPFLTYLVLAVVALWRIITYAFSGQRQLVTPYLQGLLEGWREDPVPPQYIWSDEGAA